MAITLLPAFLNAARPGSADGALRTAADRPGAGRVIEDPVTLSAEASAMLAEALSVDADATFDERRTERTTGLADRLVRDFTALHIPLDRQIPLRIDGAGKVHAEGPYKEQIEAYFRDNPDAANELKAVAALNTLRAAKEALRLYREEKEKAYGDKEKEDEAWARYARRLTNIQSLSENVTLKDGALLSGSLYFVAGLPGADVSLRETAMPSG